MKDNTIQQMLERYREGTLDEGELAELNRLTHRDEVMSAAGSRAAGLIRRRRAVAFTVAGLLVAGAAVWTFLPLGGSAEPVLVAEATVQETVAPSPIVDSVTSPGPATVQPVLSRQGGQPVRVGKERNDSTTLLQNSASLERMAECPVCDEAPVVLCNNQCEADSVISDIWKFLTV